MVLSMFCVQYGIRFVRRLGRVFGSVASESAVHPPRISKKGIARECAWRFFLLVLACDLGNRRSRRRHGVWNSIESTTGHAASTTLSKRDTGPMIATARVRMDNPSGTSNR